DRLDVLRSDGMWALDFTQAVPTWQHFPTPPGPGDFGILDEGHDRFVGFRGAQTWAYALGSNTWSVIEPGSAYSFRSQHTAVVAPMLDAMLLYGGGGDNPPWRFALDGSDLSPLTTAGSPPSPRNAHGAIFDPVRQRMLVFGGRSGTVDQNDVHE